MPISQILEVADLVVDYPTRTGTVRAVDNVTFGVDAGEMLAIVGESGCGKSTLIRSILRLLPSNANVTATRMSYMGQSILALSDDQMRMLRGRSLGLVMQNPMTSLDPLARVSDAFIETMRANERGRIPKASGRLRALSMLHKLGLPADRLDSYPHELSGGMRQRISIGLALIAGAELLFADEPTTALDVLVESRLMDLLDSLRAEYGIAVILVTHDIALVKERADRLLVMYAGEMIESGHTGDVLNLPFHPYTKALVAVVPTYKRAPGSPAALAGEPPDLAFPPPGCRFHPRCPVAMERCQLEAPAESLLQQAMGNDLKTRRVRCWLMSVPTNDDIR